MSPTTTLSITGVDVAFGARTLVRDLDLVLVPGRVTALVGPNGSGKSTLMRMVLGELPVETGTIRLTPPEATIGWLPQVTPDPRESLLAFVRRRTGVEAADRALDTAATGLADERPGAGDAYAEALARWLALGAADLEERLTQVTAGLGLEVDPGRPLGSLSGGESARAALASVLLSQYDVLLLDEPTNDLDDHGRELIEEFIARHRGPVLVASHDRAFLDRVATHVVELDLAQQQVGHFAGGWSDYVEARELRWRQAHEAFEEYVAQRDRLAMAARRRADWADRGRRQVALGGEPDKHIREKHRARADRQAGRAAITRRAAERLEVVEQPRKEWQLRYRIDAGPPSADVVWTLDRAVAARGDFRVGPVDLVVTQGERLALAGPNGSGKSTLLHALLGRTPLHSGRVSTGSRVRVGVIDQGRALLDSDESVADLVHSVADLVHEQLGRPGRGAVRTLLAKFGLGADHVDRPARTLSLGERTRALMATFQARQVNTLVLDEPTNHLDVPAIEQLEAALAGFSGTLVVVSHDRAFLDAIGIDRVLDLGSEVPTQRVAVPST